MVERSMRTMVVGEEGVSGVVRFACAVEISAVGVAKDVGVE